MERKTKEDFAQMSKEELEVVAIHLQDRVESLEAAVVSTREVKDMFYNKANMMEARLDILFSLLKNWKGSGSIEV